jgi:hypothetical protein
MFYDAIGLIDDVAAIIITVVSGLYSL